MLPFFLVYSLQYERIIADRFCFFHQENNLGFFKSSFTRGNFQPLVQPHRSAINTQAVWSMVKMLLVSFLTYFY